MGRPRKIREGPKKPLSAYAAFVREVRPFYATNHPDLSFKHVAMVVGVEWKKLPQNKRQKYIEVAHNDKIRYEKEKQEYQDRLIELAKNPPEGPKRKGPKKKSKLAPKNPLSAYTSFVKDIRPQIHQENPDKSFAEVAGIVGRMWKELTPDKRVKYDKKADQDKKRYELEKARYQVKLAQLATMPQGKRNKRRTGPKKAISAYTFFVMENRPKISMENPNLSFKDVAQRVGYIWRHLTEQEKQKYHRRAEEDKERYELEKQAFM